MRHDRNATTSGSVVGTLAPAGKERGAVPWCTAIAASTAGVPVIEKVYVPLDGSEVADAAIRPGAQLALRAGTPLVLMAARWPDSREITMRSYLDAHVAFLDGPVESWVISDRDPAEAIVEVAGEAGAVVCMATRGRGAFRRAVIGGVAESVVRSSRGAIVLVGAELDPGWTLGEDPSILVGFDESSHARAAAVAASEIASSLHGSVQLAQVFDPVDSERRRMRRRSELEHAATLVEELQKQGVDVRSIALDGFDPAGLLLHEARDRGAAMLAVGCHGRSGVSRFALGSVSFAVVGRSRVPVIVAGPRWAPERRPDEGNQVGPFGP
jgi:nucleotide-binding universal stress UspA family protein